MGEFDVKQVANEDELREFTKYLLRDARAFEQMLDEDRFERDAYRIGAEQEMFLVDANWRPATKAMEVLERIDDEHFTTELGQFNIECNLDPLDLGGDCFRQMETQLIELVDKARSAAEELDSHIAMIGILPTLEKSHLTLENMTPMERYYALNNAMNRLKGGEYHLHLRGRDELIVTHDNVMLEACNTSFQVHLQVDPGRFVQAYNMAQAITAPVLAAATNSPFLFGRNLWRETRIGLFQQSVDTRKPSAHLRQEVPRVSFGRKWVDESIIELFREDISRFRVLMSTDISEDPFEVLRQGGAPKLRALFLHNGTIYRWNRVCYGQSNGLPHIRIENRVLPSGPTPLDEVANSAFWVGLLEGMLERHGDIRQQMDFSSASENFVAAARQGLRAHLDWPGRPHATAKDLILEELLPIAREGLQRFDIESSDIDRYIGTIDERVRCHGTGAQWAVDSYDALRDHGTKQECLAAIVAATVHRQTDNIAGHTWQHAALSEVGEDKQFYQRLEDLMTTDLFTVNEEELVDMVANVMHWQHLRHVPVEDNQHRLIGLVTVRSLLRLMGDSFSRAASEPVPVREIMQTGVITARPDTPTSEAIRLMRERKISCLPVVDQDGRLVGMVTERHFLDIAGNLLEKQLSS